MPSLSARRTPLAALAAVLLILTLSLGWAQSEPLERLAPRDTLLALGLTPGPLPEGTMKEALADLDVEGARAAWDRLLEAAAGLELGDLGMLRMMDLPLDLLDDLADGGPMAPGGPIDELSERCPELEADAGELLGRAWADDLLLVVAMDPFAPLPAGLAVARLDAEAVPAAERLQAGLIACFGGEVIGEQDGAELIVVGDGGDLPLVLARQGELFLAGTRPDVVRGALRRAAGSDEPSLADDPSRLAADGATGARLTVRPDLLADVLEARVPVPSQPGMADVLQRGTQALRTLGSFSSRIVVDDAGIVTESALAVRREGGDPELAELLLCSACRASGPFLASDDAVAVSGSSWRLRAWVDWLDGLVGDLSGSMGEPVSLRGLLQREVGVDLDAALLDWLGDELHTVRFDAVSPDLRALLNQPANLVAIPVASPEAAEAGLTALADAILSLADRLAALDDDMPDGARLRGMVAVDERSVAGVPYRRVRIGPTTEYAIGVVGNRLTLAAPADAFEIAVALQQGGRDSAFASAGWRAVQELAGPSRIGWGYGDGGADLRGVADLLELAAQPLAFAAAAALDSAAQRGGPRAEVTPGMTTSAAVDVATASRYGAPNLAGDPADAGAFRAEPPTVDLADAAARYGAPDFGFAAPAPVELPTELDGVLGDDATEVDGSPMDLYRLPVLPAGTEVSVVMTSNAFDTYLYLIDADASAFLAENDDAPDTSRSEIRYVSDGATPVWVGASTWGSFGSGPYRLELSRIGVMAPAEPEADEAADEPVEPADLDAPGGAQGELRDDTARIGGSPMDLYRLPVLPAGTEVTVVMTSDAFDTYLYLIDPEAEAYLGENDDAPDTSRSEINYVSDGATPVWVGASTWGSFGAGPYRLSVETETPTTPDVADDTPPADAEQEEVPSFAELLPAFDLVPDALDVVASRIGDYLRVAGVDGDVVRRESRQAIDW